MPEDDARKQAIDRLQQKRGITQTAVGFVAVSALLVVIWLVGGRGFFWPVFPMAGFAIALGLQAYNVYGRRSISEGDIQREMRREGDSPSP
jgi:hypothetical protein